MFFYLLPPSVMVASMYSLIMKSFLSVIDFISNWSGKVFAFLWIPVVLVISQEVIRRYVFGAPTLWGFETMIFLCGVLYIIGGAYTLLHRRHIYVDAVYARFSLRIRAIIDLVTFPFFFLFVGILLWAGADRAWAAILIRETSGSPWNPPIYPIFLAIPLGAFLILLQGLAKFIRDLSIAIRGQEAE